MSPGDKATLRLAIGLGLAVLVAYGLSLAVPFVVCVMSVVVLSRPGPPVPLVKGLVVALAPRRRWSRSGSRWFRCSSTTRSRACC